VFAVLAVAALGLTACGGDAEGEPGSSASPANSAVAAETATPSATPKYKPASADGPAENVPLPKMPSEASLKSQQGLEAFIPYWFETLSYAYESGDLRPLKELTGPQCFSCDEFAKVINAWHVQDGWIAGGQVKVTDIEDRFVETKDGSFRPYVFLTQEPMDYYEEGMKADSTPGMREPVLFVPAFIYENGSWILMDIERPSGAA
jgi:hypothetical protein